MMFPIISGFWVLAVTYIWSDIARVLEAVGDKSEPYHLAQYGEKCGGIAAMNETRPVMSTWIYIQVLHLRKELALSPLVEAISDRRRRMVSPPIKTLRCASRNCLPKVSVIDIEISLE